MTSLTRPEILAAAPVGWSLLATHLTTRFATGDFAGGLRLVERIGVAAQAADHHPDLTLTYDWVEVRLRSHDVGAVSQRDLSLAATISSLAADLGLSADATSVAAYELGLDAADATRIGPFWAALLTGSADGFKNLEVTDPAGRVPLLWFQSTEEHETPRQRFHIDLWLDPAAVDDRIAAAVAAGGAVVDETQAPSFIVLADADGNRACICTSLERA